ncbi:MAG: hypothetical protein ACFB15_25735 [Cyclobacteriaceae bacterium]
MPQKPGKIRLLLGTDENTLNIILDELNSTYGETGSTEQVESKDDPFTVETTSAVNLNGTYYYSEDTTNRRVELTSAVVLSQIKAWRRAGTLLWFEYGSDDSGGLYDKGRTTNTSWELTSNQGDAFAQFSLEFGVQGEPQLDQHRP